MIADYGEFGGLRTGKGNQGIQRKPTPMKLCPQQIPSNLTWDRTWAATVESW
jgi:hypothetical protein